MDTRYQICQVVPLINVGCRKKLANDDFEKNAPVCFLICRKKGYVFKIIRKNTLPRPPPQGGGALGWGGLGEGVFSNDFENIPPFFYILENTFLQPTFIRGRKLPNIIAQIVSLRSCV